MSSHTGGKKRVGWVEQSESEELGGYGEPEGGGGEETSGSVEIIAMQYAQPQAKAVEAQRAKVTKAGGCKSKGKEKAKASRAKVQATIHLTKTEREIETSGISIAPPPQPSTSSYSTSAHHKKDSEPHGHLQSPSALSPHRRASFKIQFQAECRISIQVHGQAMQIEEPVTPPRHKHAISELPPWTPDNLNEDIVMRSPPKQHIPAYGASRSTGGILHGRASGNVFNMADANQVWLDQSNTVDMVDRGKILLFHSADSPQNVKITNNTPIVQIPVKDISQCPTIKTVVHQATEDFEPMQSNKSKLVFCMYHHDEHDWTSYGIYTKIMAFSDDEDIDALWFRDSNGKNIIYNI
ncbi:hypothetical protein CPB84DRAFT_1846274 [Gymnopilus junonius]|uniref:Uncharacterized protein n=1 Tax=Gymnopilus junonius TaxID=109634 RepID=A0A9P5TNE6_GYMJU|nr:hypothetical protein CPB84DRAFT_1846274 [Gymnopilus junonius]